MHFIINIIIIIIIITIIIIIITWGRERTGVIDANRLRVRRAHAGRLRPREVAKIWKGT